MVDPIFISHGSERVFLPPLAREPRARAFREELRVGTFSEDAFVKSEDEVVVVSVGDESVDDVEDVSRLALVEDSKLGIVSKIKSVVPSD